MNQLEAGKKYELIITNEAGLYRYCLKDVVAVTGFRGKSPLIRFAYRKEQVINLAGLHMTMEHTTETIRLLEKALHTNINDYSLYADNDHIPGRIVLFIETEDEISDAELSGAKNNLPRWLPNRKKSKIPYIDKFG